MHARPAARMRLPGRSTCKRMHAENFMHACKTGSGTLAAQACRNVMHDQQPTSHRLWMLAMHARHMLLHRGMHPRPHMMMACQM